MSAFTRFRRNGAVAVRGQVSPGYEAVAEAFADNFTLRGELGGAVCAYRGGARVVDLWGGIRDARTGAPWEEGTMAIVWSATKGLAAMTLALAHSRGWLDYDARVSRYWPEFAAHGKEAITVRQLLGHQAALFAFDEPVDAEVVRDPDRLAAVLARQKPAWEPGTRIAYHALTLGFHQGELLRRIDPRHRTLGEFFRDEIAAALGAEAYIRLPGSVPDARLARLRQPSMFTRLRDMPLRITLEALSSRSILHRALVVNPGSGICLDDERVYARDLEVPSGGGVCTARALAQCYAAFTDAGGPLGLRAETIAALAAQPTPPTRGFHDECLHGEVHFHLGFMKPGGEFAFGTPAAFGSPGAGGAFGYADPETQVAYGYVTSQMGATITGDPRDVALRAALEHATGAC